jgi:CubicO group peptidase (beta-lactamase class C family)
MQSRKHTATATMAGATTPVRATFSRSRFRCLMFRELVVTCLLAAPGQVLAEVVSSDGSDGPRITTTDFEAGGHGHQLTSVDVGRFLDTLVPAALRQESIPGAVVIVVANGSVLFAKGYGYADVGTRTPVDPATTVFRPGSISKTITWTAVMQLVEAGRIDLDRDVNDYLDFRIPAAFPEPITMRHLMTHTAGFENTNKNIAFRNAAEFLDTEHFLKRWIPTRINPPGKVVAYSNYGAGLAGYIVQRVSGEPFERYVEQHIFAPLEMSHSTFIEPAPAQLLTREAHGYVSGSGPPQAFELLAPVPAGAMSTTAEDMAHFMIAHLQNGRYGEATILRPDTVGLMHATAYAPVPTMNGMALGFYHEDRNGQRIIGHAGGTLFFHSDLHLFLDAGVGVFVSMNAPGSGNEATDPRRKLFEGFTDRYFGVRPTIEPTLATAFAHGNAVVGQYMSSQRSQGNPGSFFGLFDQRTVRMSRDGALELDGVENSDGQPARWHEVAPWMWREVGGRHRLGTLLVDNHVSALYCDYFAPSSVLQPTPAWRSAAWNIPLLLATLLILVVALLEWPVSTLLRAVTGKASMARGANSRGHVLTRIACAMNLVFVGGIIILIATVSSPAHFALTYAIDPWLRLFQIAGVFGVIGTGACLHQAYGAWARSNSWWLRAWKVLVAAACVAVAWFAFAFSLLCLHLDF